MAAENSRFPQEAYVRSITASKELIPLSRFASDIVPGGITAAGQFVLPSSDEFDLSMVGIYVATALGKLPINKDLIQVDHTEVSKTDRKFARDFGKVNDPFSGFEIRTIVNAALEKESIIVSVGPALVHMKHPLSRLDPTAFHIPEFPLNDQSERYIRLIVDDHAGVLAQIAGIFGENQVNIVGVIQREFEKDEKGNRIRDDVDIAFLFKPVPGGNSALSISQISELDVVRTLDTVFPVFR